MLNIYDTAGRLLIASLLGGVIGFEREKRGRHPGLRTHMLVCIGSTLIMLVSIYIFDVYGGKTPVDPGRIAAGVVTGVGFLVAGTIIISAEKVTGLTTAASIWTSAAIGLAVGCGYESAAFITTIICFIILSTLKRVEKKIGEGNSE